MKGRVLVVVMMLLLAGVALLRGQAVPAAAPANAPGRYQITACAAPGDTKAFMVDSQTGDVWHWNGAGWFYGGNPTQKPGVH